MVGKAIWKVLSENGFINLIGKSSKELDLRDQLKVKDFFIFEKTTGFRNR